MDVASLIKAVSDNLLGLDEAAHDESVQLVIPLIKFVLKSGQDLQQ